MHTYLFTINGIVSKYVQLIHKYYEKEWLILGKQDADTAYTRTLLIISTAKEHHATISNSVMIILLMFCTNFFAYTIDGMNCHSSKLEEVRYAEQYLSV